MRKKKTERKKYLKNTQGWVIAPKNVGQALWPLLYWGRDRMADNTPCMTSSSLSSTGEKAKFCVIGEVKDGAYPSLQPSKHTTLVLYFIIEAICSLKKNRAGCPHPFNSADAPMSSPSANREQPPWTSSSVFAPSPCSLVFLLPLPWAVCFTDLRPVPLLVGEGEL